MKVLKKKKKIVIGKNMNKSLSNETHIIQKRENT